MAAPVPLRGFVLWLFPRTPQRSPSAPLALLLRWGQHSPGSTGTEVGLVPLVQRRWGERRCTYPPKLPPSNPQDGQGRVHVHSDPENF